MPRWASGSIRVKKTFYVTVLLKILYKKNTSSITYVIIQIQLISIHFEVSSTHVYEVWPIPDISQDFSYFNQLVKTTYAYIIAASFLL